MSLAVLRTRRAALLAALGLVTTTLDTDASACTKKCKKKPTSKRQACKQKCKGGAFVDRNCDDFATQAEAQASFLSEGGPHHDPHGLDTDHEASPVRTCQRSDQVPRMQPSTGDDEAPA